MTAGACPRCGLAAPSGQLALCPRCLLADESGAPAAPPGVVLEQEIGRGGMGRVFRGRQLRLDRPVAVKLLPPELATDPAFEARFAREARALYASRPDTPGTDRDAVEAWLAKHGR